MAENWLTEAQRERRLTIRRVATQACLRGWTWTGKPDQPDGDVGWWNAEGDFVSVDQLFRSTHPQDFLLEAKYSVLVPASEERMALPKAVSAEGPALPEGGDS